MSGMLNGAGLGGLDPQMLSQLMGMARQDPFSRAMPGNALLGDGGMASPQMQGQQQNMDQQADPNAMFAEMAKRQPALPNLPQSFDGFGFGRFAPRMHEGNPMRQQLIQQLMQMMPQLGQGLPGVGGM